MNNIRPRIFQTSVLVVGMILLFMVAPAWAQEGEREWRPIYDLVMRWVNFGILVFLLVRFVVPLVVKFLNNQKSEIQTAVERVESEKNDMLARVQEAKDSLENSGPRLEEIKNRIIEQGELHKQELIDKAQEQGRLMLKSASERVDYQIGRARRSLMNEMMDMAVERALEKLPSEMNEEDNNKLIKKYLNIAASQ